MRLHLWWFDNNWQQRGYAKHLHLFIYFDEKKYVLRENMYYGYDGREHIQVKRKSDLTDYVEELIRNGFTVKEN